MVDVYWRIGTHGDQPSLRRQVSTRGDWSPHEAGSITPARRAGLHDGYSYLDHMADVAKAAEASGFVGGLLPSFPFTDDPFAATASLVRETRTFRFMVAYQPGFLDPVHAARLSASLQRASDGRLVYNVITGGGGPQQLWWGDTVGHDDRYARTAEFLDALKGSWSTTPYDLAGRFFDVQGAHLPPELAAQPVPEIYFSGSSAAAIATAGRHADYYLSWLEPFSALEQKFAQVREESERRGTRPRFALRIEILARPTEREAWAEIERGWANVDPAALDFEAQGDSVGAARARGFVTHPVRGPRDLEVEPQVWAGFHLLRGGPAFGLVGSYDQVAARLDQLVELGADAFILAAVPHLEEAYRVGSEVLPRVSFTRTNSITGREPSRPAAWPATPSAPSTTVRSAS
ncbi:LLM class flavin-dependent oxidoreductase [Mumia sp. DW29H23]|uniref:LLM class flavin-dependent oxidoreductase n=1 Tax=Mumia sp. DW29H23 TaxID=3421241 RepID=UPI003D68E2A6